MAAMMYECKEQTWNQACSMASLSPCCGTPSVLRASWSISHLSCQKLNSAFQSEEQKCAGSLFPRKYPPASFHAHCPTPLLHGITSREATKSSLNLLEVVQASSFLSCSTLANTLQTLADLAGNQKSSQKSVAESLTCFACFCVDQVWVKRIFCQPWILWAELPCLWKWRREEAQQLGSISHKHL